MTHPKSLIALAAISAMTTGSAFAANITLYAGGEDFFGGVPGGFTFDDFNGGQASDTGSSLLIDTATEIAPGNGLFGGIGRDMAGGPVDFDADTDLARIEYRILGGNVAADFRLILSDQDSPTQAQDYQYFVDPSFATPLGDGSGYSEQFVGITQSDSIFDQAAFGFVAGDGVVNYGLRQWQIQSPFGSADRLNIEIRLIEIVPEPTSALLIGAGGLTLLRRRRSA